MSTPLRALIVEDSEDDAALLLRELKRAGYEPLHRRVQTAEDLIAALEGHDWDIILADYSMPQFSGTQALSLVRSRGLDTPFIFVSGTIGEDIAVSAMKAGAQDYLIKGNLKRLIPAIERELREIAVRRERVRAEADRRATEARFRQILDVAADAIIVVDADQRITIFNRSAEALFGYTAAEVVGQFLDLLLPSRFAASHRRHVLAFAGAPEAFRRMNARAEVTGRRKNGEEFPVEASISKLLQDGAVTYTAVVRDVTERKRAEDRLRQFSRAVEQSANLVMIADADGTIQYVNPAFLRATGYAEDEVLGRKPSFWRSGKTSAAEYEGLWRAILAAKDWHGEFENLRSDGSLMAVSATISPVRDDTGRITHFIGIQEDITQRKDIEAQLQHAQKMEAIGQLTGGLAHDFNNLLAVIIGNIELLQEDLPPDGKPASLADMALKAGLRGADLTRQLLAFARRQPLEPEAFDLNARVAETVVLLRRTLGEKIEVRTALAPDVWPVEADAPQVESALANLAINARDAMPQGGQLLIETGNKRLDADYATENVEAAPGDYVMLAVSDTGTGMTPEILARVCEPFFTTKPAGRGTGLGLSMVYGFAKQSGGHLKIYSEPGHGTTVRLYLPRASAAAADAEVAAANGADAAPDATILVVEDNADVRAIVVRQLLDLGYGVREADGPAAALAILAEGGAIDLLFTDIVMPGGMAGTELARAARAQRPGLKVVLTSGFAEGAAQDDTPPEERLPLISKPYRKLELQRKLRAVLEGE